MTSYPAPAPAGDGGAVFKLLSLFLGLAVVVMGSFGLWLALSAQHAADRAESATATTPSASMPGMAIPAQAGRATQSFAGAAPTNADALAMARTAYPATLPAAPAGGVANVHLTIAHDVVSIAPGVEYEAWTFNGTAPAPVVHVRQGQL